MWVCGLNEACLSLQAGLDSLGAVELRNSIAEALGGLDLPGTLVFDCPTPAAIAAHILRHHQPADGEKPNSVPECLFPIHI